MLNIFWGRENLNKDKFIFDNIKGDTLLIVPDQYTLQAERDALFYLGKKGFMDPEILGFSKLGTKVLDAVGGGRTPMVDKYGRYMLLASIMKKREEDLKLYSSYSSNTSFIEMINDFISQLKQYDVSPEGLRKIIASLPDSRKRLKKKLEEVLLIYEDYEESIKGKYIDTEDLINLQAEKIDSWEAIKNKNVFVCGFDYFTPNNLKILGKLIKNCKEVNVVLIYDSNARDQELFTLGEDMKKKLEAFCNEERIPCNFTKTQEEYRYTNKRKSMGILERELFALPCQPAEINSREDNEGISIVKAANYYGEAETVASKIQKLLREEDYRYKDIILICNDMDVRGSIYKRVFAQYDMELYLDNKRNLLHNPGVSYVLNLLKILGKSYKKEDVIALLKSGLGEFSMEEVEIFENYCDEYFISGSRFKKPFEKGRDEYKEDFELIETIRKKTIEGILAFGEEFKSGKKLREKVECLYGFLRDEAKIPERIDELTKTQLDEKMTELAGETAQVWNALTDILQQMINIQGESNISMEDFFEMFKTGIQSLEVKLLPPTSDSLVLGAMSRTRCANVKAMFILGANEGVLPEEGVPQDILTEEEKEYLDNAEEVSICKVGTLLSKESKVALYRNLTKADEYLCISCADSSEDGKKLNPSEIYNTFKRIFPGVTEEKDVESAGRFEDVIGGRSNTLNHLGKYMKEYALSRQGGKEMETSALESLLWFRDNENSQLKKMEKGLNFRNTAPDLEPEVARKLYERPQSFNDGQLSLSPSRLENFSRCPFKHFVSYGINPREPKEYSVKSFDMGDIYHKTLMEMAKRLSTKGLSITDEKSLWMRVNWDDLEKLIDEIIDENIRNYREGLMSSDGSAIYRTKRTRKMCKISGKMLVEQVRCGQIDEMAFEESFGRGRKIPPIIIPLEKERGYQNVLIEGTIDRVDVLPGDMVKVIDYKSSNEKYDEKEARGGWKLQLFIYLEAAKRYKEQLEPVGAFYFHVDNPMISRKDLGKVAGDEELKETLESKLRNTFKMDGFLLNRKDVVEKVAGDDANRQKEVFSSRQLLDEEKFKDVTWAVLSKVEELVGDLAKGKIAISPKKKSKEMTACTYCDYRGICKFDQAFPDCRFEDI